VVLAGFLKRPCDFEGVLRVPAHAVSKSLKAAMNQPAVERRRGRPFEQLNPPNLIDCRARVSGNHHATQYVCMSANVFSCVRDDYADPVAEGL